MEVIEISKLVDDRNRMLWEAINSAYVVDLAPSGSLEYRCYSQGNNATIFVATENLCSDSFTHELLHLSIYLKRVFIGTKLTLKISTSKILSKILDADLLEHIGNCLNHIKMLPIYLDMGYNREKFLFDYNEDKCTNEEIRMIQQAYKKGSFYNTLAVRLFIGKFMAVMADPNEAFNYDPCLMKLKSVDATLFHLLQEFVED